MKELLETLENSKGYTLAVAEAMPEKGYAFKPVDTVWSFGELLHHVAYGIEWWEENYVKGNSIPWSPPQAKTKKSEVTSALKKAYDGLAKTVGGSLTPAQVKGFHATLDHITHHRGQAVTYLRMNDVAPPEYVY